MGVADSGKSTIGVELSKQISHPFYDGDDFHSKGSKEKMKAGIPLTDEDRLPWLQTLKELILKHIERDESIILACSALKTSYRELLNVGPECRFVYLKGSFDLISKRMEKRKGHFFNPTLLKNQFDILEEPNDCLIIGIHHPVENIVKKIRDALNL